MWVGPTFRKSTEWLDLVHKLLAGAGGGHKAKQLGCVTQPQTRVQQHALAPSLAPRNRWYEKNEHWEEALLFGEPPTLLA